MYKQQHITESNACLNKYISSEFRVEICEPERRLFHSI